MTSEITTIRTSPDSVGEIPSITPLFDTADSNGQNHFALICETGTTARCTASDDQGMLYATKVIQVTPGEAYQFSLSILDPVTMAFQFSVNGEILGEYTVPAEKAAVWNGMEYRIHVGVVSMAPIQIETEYYLDDIAITAR